MNIRNEKKKQKLKQYISWCATELGCKLEDLGNVSKNLKNADVSSPGISFF